MLDLLLKNGNIKPEMIDQYKGLGKTEVTRMVIVAGLIPKECFVEARLDDAVPANKPVVFKPPEIEVTMKRPVGRPKKYTSDVDKLEKTMARSIQKVEEYVNSTGTIGEHLLDSLNHMQGTLERFLKNYTEPGHEK